MRSPSEDRCDSGNIIGLNQAKRFLRVLELCRTVIRDVLMPLVAKYGQSIGLWSGSFPGRRLVLEDEEFTDFLEGAFHEDFKLVGRHCVHMRQAIATMRRENSAELRIWIGRKLREYLALKTAIKERMVEQQNTLRIRGPLDRFSDHHYSAEEVLA